MYEGSPVLVVSDQVNICLEPQSYSCHETNLSRIAALLADAISSTEEPLAIWNANIRNNLSTYLVAQTQSKFDIVQASSG
jgi:hypothetical protein